VRRAARAAPREHESDARPVVSVKRCGRLGSCLCVGDGGGREPSCEEETQHPETGRDRPCWTHAAKDTSIAAGGAR